MYCTHCGNQVDDDDIFCAVCGTKVKRPGAKKENKKAEKKEEITEEKVIEEHEPESSIPAIPPELLQSLAEPKKKEKRNLTTGEIIGIIAVICSIIILLIYFALSVVNRKLTQFVNNANAQAATENSAVNDAAAVSAGVTNEEARAGYKKFIQSKDFGKDDEAGRSHYYIYDIDKDGIDDIIINSGTSEADSKICIVTFRNGKMLYFEDIDGMHADVYSANDTGIYINYGGWGGDSQTVVKYTLSGADLYQNIISDTHEVKEEKDVVKIDGTSLERHKLTDLSALD